MIGYMCGTYARTSAAASSFAASTAAWKASASLVSWSLVAFKPAIWGDTDCSLCGLGHFCNMLCLFIASTRPLHYLCALGHAVNEQRDTKLLKLFTKPVSPQPQVQLYEYGQQGAELSSIATYFIIAAVACFTPSSTWASS